MNLKLLLALVPTLLFSEAYFGEAPKSISAQITRNFQPSTLDQTGELDLQIHYPESYELKEIELIANKNAEIAYTLTNLTDQVDENQKRIQNIRIRYEPQVEGTHQIELPLLLFESKKEPHHRHTLYPPSIECEVRMLHEDPLEELEVAAPLTLDEKPPLELDQYNKKVFLQKREEDLKEVHQKFLKQAPSMKWKWFVWAFVIGFVSYKLFQLLTRRKTLKNLFSAEENPREKALKALKVLKLKNLPEKGRYDDFYVEITQIVRQYIEGYYKIKAPEQTTQEFLQVMLGQSIFNEQINHYLTEFLKFADLVKFAKLSPKEEDCHQAEEAAESFILSESKS